MKRIIIAQAVLLVFMPAMSQLEPAFSSPASHSEESGRVVGVVFDHTDARVWRAIVTIKNKGFERKAETGTSGEFEVELPVAKEPYYFTVKANGFCTFEGELLRVRPNAAEMINIHLEVQGSHSECRCSSGRK